MTLATPKKLYMKTYGCQMNVYDSQRMTDILAPLGYKSVDLPDDADMAILNTCHIREKAEEKVFSDLGRLRPHKKRKIENGENMIIAVAGCVAQAQGAEIMRRAPYVDMVFGPQTYHRLPEMIARATRAAVSSSDGSLQKRRGRGVIELDFPAEPKFDFFPEVTTTEGPAAFLSIQEGCDKFCTFCVVPYTRGAEYSRPAQSILAEACRLVEKGVKEITLLGQNVNAYHGDAPHEKKEWGLGRLIQELAEIEGLERLRYMTSHPRDMDDELVAAHRDVPQLMPFLHLPVQSGSDRILKEMNRRHTRDFYVKWIDQLKAARTDMAFSSDFIVGFPGETDEDFAQTMALVREIGYGQAYSFKYSPRPGTPAALQENQVLESLKDERLQVLQALLNEQQLQFNQSMVGRKLPILLERPGRQPRQYVGRSPYMQSVHLEAPESLYGSVVSTYITQGFANGLQGCLA